MRRITCTAIALIYFTAVIPSRPQSTNLGDIEAIKQIEQTMGTAMIADDVATLSHIYADDFATIGSDGE